MNYGECETTTDKSILVLRENRSQLIIKNLRREKIKQVVVDGCAITEGQRCDFLIIDSSNSEYFVELKGCDVEKAIKQLETTIIQLGGKAKSIKRYALIISSRCPLFTPKIQQYKSHFMKNFMATLIIKNHVLEIDI